LEWVLPLRVLFEEFFGTADSLSSTLFLPVPD
jgi:hypothetical protein